MSLMSPHVLLREERGERGSPKSQGEQFCLSISTYPPIQRSPTQIRFPPLIHRQVLPSYSCHLEDIMKHTSQGNSNRINGD